MAGTFRVVRVRVSGRVQGVGYRAWTAAAAGKLGLGGWVRNRRDGTVEAVLAGPAEAVEAMLKRCHEGPAASRVTALVIDEVAGPAPASFEILPTA
jgi:acylphosphatase